MPIQVTSVIRQLRKFNYWWLGLVVLCCWSACSNSSNQTKKADAINKYVLPAYKQALELKLKNPDSTLLLCDYMLRLTNDNEEVDSLRLEIEMLKAQTILNKGFSDKALEMYKAIINTPSVRRTPFEIAQVNFRIADLLNNNGQSKEAVSYVELALKEFDINKHTLNRGRALNLKGLILMNLGNFKEAELSLNESLDIFEKGQSLNDYANVLQNIGNVHFDMKDSILARTYYLRSAAIHEKINNINDLGSIYNNIGLLYRYSNPDSALYYYSKVPAPDGDNENIRHYVISLFNKANIYKDRHEYEKSREVFDEVYRICETYKILQGFPRVLFSYGDIEFETGHFSKAVNYFDQALQWCDSLGAIPLKQDVLKGKIYMYSQKGLFKEAFQLQQQYDRIEDSIKNNETKEAIAKAEKNNQDKLMLLEKLEKQQVAEKVKQDKNNRVVYILSTIIVLLAIGAAMRLYRKRL